MSASTPNPFWAMIQRYMDDPAHRYAPRAADLARECDLSEQLLSKWKKRPTLPEPEQLRKLAIGTGILYPRLLEAALEGKGYFIAGKARIVSEDLLHEGDARDLRLEEETMPWIRKFGRPEALAAADDEVPLETEQDQTEEST